MRFDMIEQLPLEIIAWLQDVFDLEQQGVTSTRTINCHFQVAPSVLGTSWGDSPVGYHWRVTVDNFCADTTGSPAPWSHWCLVVLNEPREGALSRVWEKITATARLRRVVVVIHDRPGGKRLTRKQYMRHSTNDVTCTELVIFPAGTISFGHAAGWNDYADRNGYSTNSNSASSTHSHTWTCDEGGHIMVPDTHCPSVLRRHDGLLNKRDVRILLLGPPSDTKESETLASQVSDVRKLAFLLGGTSGRSSGNPKDGPVWFGSGEAMRLDWPLQVNNSKLDFTAPWRQVRWMRNLNSLSPLSLPVGAVQSALSGHQETAQKHVQVLYAFADRDLQGLIIPHSVFPLHLSKLPPLLGSYTGMLKSFHLEFTKAQLTVVSNLSELHKAHVLHHWRLVGIPMIRQDAAARGCCGCRRGRTRAFCSTSECHLCHH